MKKVVCTIVTASWLVLVPALAKATVIYSNFGVGDSYDLNTGYNIDDSQYVAASFTVSGGDFRLASIEWAMFLIAGPDDFTVDLRSNASGVPGAAIESWRVTNATLPSSILSVNATMNDMLLNGSTYWLEVRPTTPGTMIFGAWNRTFPQDNGEMGFSHSQGANWQVFPSEVRSVFRVNGDAASAVPEPGTMILLGSGLAGLIARRRKMLAS